MKKYSRAQCLQVVFKWFSKKCIYIPQERAYKMLTIGESKWRVWSCLLYYFFQRFKFEMFPNTKVWREVHARKDSQIPRLPSLIALTPDRLTKRGIFSELSSSPPTPARSPPSLGSLCFHSHCCQHQAFLSGWEWLGHNGLGSWAGQEQWVEAGTSPQCHGPAEEACGLRASRITHLPSEEGPQL